MQDWMLDVHPGDELTPDPEWNKTEAKGMHLRSPTVVLDVKYHAGGQSDIAFQVTIQCGDTRWLDAGWFQAPAMAYDDHD